MTCPDDSNRILASICWLTLHRISQNHVCLAVLEEKLALQTCAAAAAAAATTTTTTTTTFSFWLASLLFCSYTRFGQIFQKRTIVFYRPETLPARPIVSKHCRFSNNTQQQGSVYLLADSKKQEPLFQYLHRHRKL